ncbi:extracellular calcium-sensing receptor-like isoform X2 [Rhinatrema bivittatum]|uniref:extracellular calcium-sensing receptor-like isoform X2 n=1 Tax=Rhinatrema bivittatum TaxID=194408 RepID=UPI00112E572F|nr:extracellular calcium-sensing receptor-like isoform X2 [Rhinatrema bivittatum]
MERCSCLEELFLHYVKNVHFKNAAGEEIFFDENGDVPLSVDILNWQLYSNGSSRYVQVGIYDARSPKGKDLIVDEGRIQWNGGHSQVRQRASHSTGFIAFQTWADGGY